MDWSNIILGIIGGFAAGVINIISGSGSIITLSLMSFFNIPMDIANGTNRIGILVHGVKGSHAFHQKGELQLEGSWKMILFCMAGAIGGIVTALYISPEEFNFLLGIIFSILLLIIVFEPHKRLKENKKIIKYIPWLMIPIGFYGGFIQVATGIFLLTVLHIISGKSLREMNPLKVFIIMLFNIPAIVIFAMGGKINWTLGISLAVGQYFGAILGVRINSSNKNIEPFLRYLLIALVIVSIAKFWGLF
ncbi:MAG: putative membrane protein YfcA [Saprospiraceae bacterium]|jgi:uncharacterized membrane protein YfcA